MQRRRVISFFGMATAASSSLAAWPLVRHRASSEMNAALEASLCTSSSAPRLVMASASPGRLSFAGTRLFKEGFLDELGAEYERSSGRSIEILGGGCDDGLAAVRTKQAMIGGLCCPLEGGPAQGLKHITVAQDLKVVIANPKVNVDDVRWKDLVALLTGRVASWKALGGSDRPVALVLHDHCPDYIEPARRMLLGERLTWSRDAMYVKTDQKHLDTVARFESAVGLNSWVLAEPYVTAGKLKLLAVDGVEPTVANARQKKYRLVGPMNMIFQDWQPAVMAPFFDFLFSPTGKSILSRRVVHVLRA